jgi:hypothetical protein
MKSNGVLDAEEMCVIRIFIETTKHRCIESILEDTRRYFEKYLNKRVKNTYCGLLFFDFIKLKRTHVNLYVSIRKSNKSRCVVFSCFKVFFSTSQN